jgi:hypothetical protein
MKRMVIGIISALTFSAIFSTSLLAATKPTPPKIDIKKVTLESEEKGMVPSGIPLMALVEVNASEDVAGPLAVNLELRKGQEKQAFKENVEKLNKGSNSFKWDLTGKPEDGQYAVSVEITCQEPKLKDKFTKTFRVGEKKKKAEKEPVEPATPQASQTKTKKSGGTKSTGEIKEITFAGVILTGNFSQQ